MNRILTAPVMINLEITEACNLTCRHCYNFWRQEDGPKPVRMTEERMSALIDQMVQAEIFHVVLTGGEPLVNFSVLKYAMQRLTAEGISTSLNSNLIPINFKSDSVGLQNAWNFSCNIFDLLPKGHDCLFLMPI